MIDLMIRVSEGNPGAATVLKKISQLYDGHYLISKLEENGTTGTLIWVKYRDKFDSDIEKRLACKKQ